PFLKPPIPATANSQTLALISLRQVGFKNSIMNMWTPIRKHKLLKVLNKQWTEGENNTKGGHTVTDYGRSLTINELHKLTKIKLQTIENLCISIETIGYIRKVRHDEENKVHNYIITQSGQSSLFDNYYINQFWNNIKFWISLFVSIVALIISIIALQD